MEFETRDGTRMRLDSVFKRITEGFAKSLFHFGIAIQGDWAFQVELHQTQIVEPKDVVRVFVRKTNRVNQAQTFANQLLSQVRRSVDQQIPFGQAEYGTTPSPLVFRVAAATNGATAAQRGNAHAGASPQQDHLPSNIYRPRRFPRIQRLPISLR